MSRRTSDFLTLATSFSKSNSGEWFPMTTRPLSLKRSYHERIAGSSRIQLIHVKVHMTSMTTFPLCSFSLRGGLFSQGPATSSGAGVPGFRPAPLPWKKNHGEEGQNRSCRQPEESFFHGRLPSISDVQFLFWNLPRVQRRPGDITQGYYPNQGPPRRKSGRGRSLVGKHALPG